MVMLKECKIKETMEGVRIEDDHTKGGWRDEVEEDLNVMEIKTGRQLSETVEMEEHYWKEGSTTDFSV
jgi:hypothetical protein